MVKKKPENDIDVLVGNALIKKEDQPYPVPDNWIWVTLGTITVFLYGKGLPKSNRIGENFPVYGSNGIVGFHNEALIKGPAIIIGRKGSIGEIHYSHCDCWPIDTTYYLEKSGNIDFDYLYLLLKSIDFKVLNRATAIPGLNREDAYKISIALPPLAEQKRIVQKLSSMLEKLKQAKDLICEAKETFENRRTAILDLAFTGKLTGGWRIHSKSSAIEFKENGNPQPFEIPESWGFVNLNKLGMIARGKSKHRPRNDKRLFGGPYPFIQTGDIARAKDFITEHIQTLSEFGLKQSHLFPKGTVCITIAANIADTAILTYDCCFPDSVVGFMPDNGKEYTSKYINYYFNYIKNELEHFAPATAQKNINLKILNDVLVPIQSEEEQKEIVRIIEALLEKESESSSLLDLEKEIELIEKSILSKAFRGELDTNDPYDEPAQDLLIRILQERQKAPLKPAPPKPQESKDTVIKAAPISFKVSISGDISVSSPHAQVLVKTINEKLRKKAFTIDELKDHITLSYEDLKTALFELIKDPLAVKDGKPLITMAWEKKGYVLQVE